jgi:hypothetical protein
MPAETYTTAEYGQRLRAGLGTAPRKAASGEFTSRMKDLLERIRLETQPEARSVKEILAPLDAGTDPELWQILNKRDVRPRQLPGLTGFVYDVRSWEDISWTTSGTVGHQVANPDTLSALGRNHRAIVFRLQMARLKGSSMICMLWAQEQQAPDSWRFWAVIPVPTE